MKDRFPLVRLYLQQTTDTDINDCLESLPSRDFVLDFEHKRLFFQLCRDHFSAIELDEDTQMIYINKLHHRRKGVLGPQLLDHKLPSDSKRVEDFIYNLLDGQSVKYTYGNKGEEFRLDADEHSLEFTLVH